jgi:ketosteroid isomerase-like protein
VGSVYHGSDALRAYFKPFSREFEPSWCEAEEVLDAGEDRVLLLTRVRGRGKTSGGKVDSRGGWLLTVRGGGAVRVDAYLERREALEAAWLRG